MIKIRLIFLISISFLTGCTGLQSFLNRPVIEDDLEMVVSTASLQADRRTVIVKLLGNDAGKFCAEPPPDVAQNITSSLEASIKAKIPDTPAELEAWIKETLKKEAVVLAERTVRLDIYRTGTYSLCQYHLNGAISGKELIDSFNALTTNALKGLGNKNK